jgi:hypothetical protein
MYYSIIYVSILFSIAFLTSSLEYAVSLYVFMILLLSPILNLTFAGVGIREVFIVKGIYLIDSNKGNFNELILLQMSISISICVIISGMIGLALFLIDKRSGFLRGENVKV